MSMHVSMFSYKKEQDLNVPHLLPGASWRWWSRASPTSSSGTMLPVSPWWTTPSSNWRSSEVTLLVVVDYPAHKYIKHAGEAFENKLEHEDHYLLSIGIRRALFKGGLVVIKISSESIKNDPLEILEVLRHITNHNGTKQPCTLPARIGKLPRLFALAINKRSQSTYQFYYNFKWFCEYSLSSQSHPSRLKQKDSFIIFHPLALQLYVSEGSQLLSV